MRYRIDPPGARSCFHSYVDAGSPIPIREEPPFSWEYAEAFSKKVVADSSPSANMEALYAKFGRKFQRAIEGKLKFGRSNRFDVDQIVACPDVLEIKYKDLPQECEKEKRWIRVYFSEPADSAGILLALAVTLKYAGKADMQTDDALSAYNQLKLHASHHSTKGEE